MIDNFCSWLELYFYKHFVGNENEVDVMALDLTEPDDNKGFIMKLNDQSKI